MSACVGFSTGRIELIPNNQQGAKQDYSDRSTIELRQHDFANFSLQARDVEKNGTVENKPLD